MSTTRVKICGITRPEDAALAAEYGADALGLNFFAGSRKITLDRAAEILSMIPPLVTPVALTSGPTAEFPEAPMIGEIQVGPATGGRAPIRILTIQYYGKSLFLEDEKNGRLPFTEVWSACRVQPGEITSQIVSHIGSLSFRPSVLLIDAAASGQAGGTGCKLDWPQLADSLLLLIQKEVFSTVILAGGLTPDNVAEAIQIVRPYAVDVSSGVEIAGKPGIKDRIKMLDFIQAAKGASKSFRGARANGQ